MENIKKIMHTSGFYAMLIAMTLANRDKDLLSKVSSITDMEITNTEANYKDKEQTVPPLTNHTEYILEEDYINRKINSQIEESENMQKELINSTISKTENIVMPPLTNHTEYINDENSNNVQNEIQENLEDTNRIYTYEELKDCIYEKSEEYGVPFDVITTIGHQESGGSWNTNGVESYTGDYGQYQINFRWNLETIKNELGFDEDDLQYNPYKSIEAATYLLKKIMNLYGYTANNYNAKEIFGTYNGWINWKENEMATTYAESCMNILAQNLYPIEEVKHEKTR